MRKTRAKLLDANCKGRNGVTVNTGIIKNVNDKGKRQE